MVSFKPIPKKLLIHEVSYIPPEKEGDGSIGGNTDQEPKIIKRVRFNPNHKLIKKPGNVESFTTGVLFIDSVNSAPFISPAEGGTIVFKGRKLKVIECKEAYTDQVEVHHLEVMLQ
ncbi:minor capsid protein [Lactococcus formosensis]|uniref:putative minor capsid protein n=1 Tax=Lactococcus formosensis TaxID=1281486 RepID=UPI0024352C02|nr:putative minor capsid protein [Lactococcus formosensis]MDG6156174.1 minor capsid protein [Lactococcus formosensis]